MKPRHQFALLVVGMALVTVLLINNLVRDQRRTVAACEARGGYPVVTRATILCLDPKALK